MIKRGEKNNDLGWYVGCYKNRKDKHKKSSIFKKISFQHTFEKFKVDPIIKQHKLSHFGTEFKKFMITLAPLDKSFIVVGKEQIYLLPLRSLNYEN